MNHDTLVTLLVALLTISESLGGIKTVSENSIYQVVIKLMKSLFQLITGKAPAETKTA